MSAAIKNITIGTASVSFGGSDLGALKAGSVDVNYDIEHIVLGNYEQLTGPAAVYRKLVQCICKVHCLETQLANIKTALGDSASVGGSNPATLAIEYGEGMMTPAALVITGQAPRTTAGVAQARTITGANAVPFSKSVKFNMGNTEPAGVDIEFLILRNESGNDIAYSDVNA